jgi:hypothetical protein
MWEGVDTELRVKYSRRRRLFYCRLPGPGRVVLITKHLWQMEAKLDELEAQGRLASKERADVVTKSQAE